MKKPLGIYIHIPFCVKKCEYCDFLSFPIGRETDMAGNEFHKIVVCLKEKEKIRKYADALCLEIERVKNHVNFHRVETIFMGGGTPSLLSCNSLKQIVSCLHRVFHLSDQIEFSIECNPGTLNNEKLKVFRELGVNRLSFGLQSADNEELKRLGRIHTYEEFLDIYNNARMVGFQNINIDLMSGLPGQNDFSLEKTLKKVIALEPEHISAYSLIIEENTPFYTKYHGKEEKQQEFPTEWRLPDEDVERKMYYRTNELLKSAGYERYEISNYAVAGFECKHNSSYWLRTDYLGFGLGAASLLDGERFHNTADPELYDKQSGILRLIREDRCRLTKQEEMEEFMFLGLRMCTGVSRKRFLELFHHTLDEVYSPSLQKCESSGWIAFEGDRVFLTERGIDLSNIVLAEFLIS